MDSEVKFYVHIDPQTLDLRSVSASNVNDQGWHPIEISSELGLAFMTGTQNIFAYAAIQLKNGSYEIHKKTDFYRVISRMDVDRKIEEIAEGHGGDIHFIINDGEVELHYDGDMVQRLLIPLKFYFTRYDDLSFLKCAFSLDVNILNTITENNKLKSWPNPIKIRIDDTYDLSIYGIKGQAASAIRKHNVKARTQRV